jgi:ferredoxin-NADP reductase
MNIQLLKKELVAEGTMRFHFSRPEGFEYQAGQSIDLTLVDPPETDAEGNTRAFSLVSIPSESELSITTRLRDTAFKRVLQSLNEGAPLSCEGPFGSFSLHEKADRAAVLLSGGIGITPFYSIIRDALERELPHKLTLFYSNRRPEDAAFLDDLTALATKHKTFTFVPTMTLMEKSSQPWSGETGYIDASMIERHCSGAADPVYDLAGPASMVAAMRKALNEIGVSNDDIRTEEFSGY